MASGAAERELLDPDTFTFQYNNLKYAGGRKETYLCYEVKKLKNGTRDFGHLSNETRETHAEKIFMKKVEKGEIKLLPSVKYSVTWYISWSPCYECSSSILEFLDKNPNLLYLHINVSRLYNCNKGAENEKENKRGLRKLKKHSRVEITVMKRKDFEYCWENFVDNKFTGWKTNSDRVEDDLEDILEDLSKMMDEKLKISTGKKKHEH